MKKKIDFLMIITTIICLFPMILSALVYNQLPEQIAVHFDAAGNPNGYASKKFAAFGLPLIFAALNLFTHFMLNSDPKKANTSKAMLLISKWLISIISLLIIPISLFMSMGIKISINIIVTSLVSVLFIALGNYLPKSKQNYTVGFKLPWTLNSEENWNKTHRFAGFLWVLGGLIMLIFSILGYYYLFSIIIIILTVLPIIYSYSLYRKGI